MLRNTLEKLKLKISFGLSSLTRCLRMKNGLRSEKAISTHLFIVHERREVLSSVDTTLQFNIDFDLIILGVT